MSAFQKILLVLVLLCGALPASSRGEIRVRSGALVLGSRLTQELNLVLKASEGLTRSLVGQNEEQIELGLRDILWQIDKVRTLSSAAKPHERGHLIRILDAAHENFELTQTSYGEERRIRLEDGYNQLVNLVRIYRLDRSYGIFFCPRDRTTWIQRGGKPVSPFRSEPQREPCGIRVPH
jgi:hypothetical protein